MKLKLALLAIGLTAFAATAQTNVIDLSPLQTNTVKVVLSSNQWNFIKRDFQIYKAEVRDTNVTYGAFQDIRASQLFSNQAVKVRREKLQRVQALLNAEPDDTKINAVLRALR